MIAFEIDINMQHTECIAEMRCFVRGDLPGIERLKQVYKNIFLHYQISSEEEIQLIVKSLDVSEDVQNVLMMVG